MRVARASLAAIVAVVIFATAHSGTAASGPHAATGGPAAHVTSVTWSGAKMFRLRVSHRVTLTNGDADLVVHGGTYAFVRIIGEPMDCQSPSGPFLCAATVLSWTRESAGSNNFHGVEATPDPAWFDPPEEDLYLFTDGVATLTMTLKSASGTAAYRATGTLTGGIRPLPASCLPAPCVGGTIPVGGLAYGGGTRVAAPRGHRAWAETFLAETSTSADNGLHGLRPCVYTPNAASAVSPVGTAFGCGLPSGGADSVQRLDAILQETTETAQPSSSIMTSAADTAATGARYFGFTAHAAGYVPTKVRAYEIWFVYTGYWH